MWICSNCDKRIKKHDHISCDLCGSRSMIFNKQGEEIVHRKEPYILLLALTLSAIHLPLMLGIADANGGHHVKVGAVVMLLFTLLNYTYTVITRRSKRINIYRILLLPANLIILLASFYVVRHLGIKIEANVVGFSFAFVIMFFSPLVRLASVGHVMLYGPIEGKEYPIRFFSSF